jgi:hypothetical protein
MAALTTVLGTITALPHAALACHNATFYWLYHANYGTPPDIATLTGRLSPTQVKMAQMVQQYGSRISKPFSGTLSLTPGTIVVFMNAQGAGHSCVMMNANQVYGYNQTNWFSTPGVAHGPSVHSLNDIVWGSGLDRSLARVGNADYMLYAVPEAKAKQFLQSL